MGEHTPTPWEVDRIAVRSSGPDGRQICLCEIHVRGRQYNETYDEALANAAFIVEAVNGYDQSRQTIEALVVALTLARKRIEYYGQVDDSSWQDFDHDIKEIYPKIDSALLLAGEKL